MIRYDFFCANSLISEVSLWFDGSGYGEIFGLNIGFRFRGFPSIRQPLAPTLSLKNIFFLKMIAELLDVLLCYCLPCCIVVALNLIIASKVRKADRSFYNSSPPPPPHHQSSIKRRTFTNNRPASLSSLKKKKSLTTSSAKSSVGSTTIITPRKNSASQKLSMPLGASTRTAGGE